MEEYNPLPNIDVVYNGCNPCISSPSSVYAIGFYQTRESLMDTETYRSFLKNIEKSVLFLLLLLIYYFLYNNNKE